MSNQQQDARIELAFECTVDGEVVRFRSNRITVAAADQMEERLAASSGVEGVRRLSDRGIE